MHEKYISALKGFVPKLTALAAAFVVARLVYMLIPNGYGFDVMGLVHVAATAVAAGVLTLLVVTALDQG